MVDAGSVVDRDTGARLRCVRVGALRTAVCVACGATADWINNRGLGSRRPCASWIVTVAVGCNRWAVRSVVAVRCAVCFAARCVRTVVRCDAGACCVRILVRDGVLLRDGVFERDAVLVGDAVLVNDGVLVRDGVLVADGVLVTDGVLVGDGVLVCDGDLVTGASFVADGVCEAVAVSVAVTVPSDVEMSVAVSATGATAVSVGTVSLPGVLVGVPVSVGTAVAESVGVIVGGVLLVPADGMDFCQVVVPSGLRA